MLGRNLEISGGIKNPGHNTWVDTRLLLLLKLLYYLVMAEVKIITLVNVQENIYNDYVLTGGLIFVFLDNTSGHCCVTHMYIHVIPMTLSPKNGTKRYTQEQNKYTKMEF